MTRFERKTIAVIGASRGIGRAIALACAAEGGAVLAVARSREGLADLARRDPTIAVLALDAATDHAPAAVFARMKPDVLVVAAGAPPPAAPLPELSWRQFSANWQVDVRTSFAFCRQSLLAPLAPGSIVILISSGAALGGSPISGGYAGAKRTQMFIAQYAQRESDRRGLNLRFVALAPMGVMPETELGLGAARGYATYLGVTPEAFIDSLASRPTVADVVDAATGLAATPPATAAGTSFVVASSGLAPARGA